tara:strand:- start:229 stop:846 length:618 start_codon:yes stop_codon:yes gene_type:complete
MSLFIKYFFQFVLVFLMVVVVGSGCRGYRSSKPPIHLNPNMDFNPKFKAQSLSLNSPEHIIPWGTLEHQRDGFIDQGPIYTGRIDGKNIRKVPVLVDQQLMDRGQTRFNIYCAVCHAATGNGNTPVIQRGYLPPPKLSDLRLLNVSDGYLFNVITNGVRSMPGYKAQISVHDRWAIVVYVRALQKMYMGSLRDVPNGQRLNLVKD